MADGLDLIPLEGVAASLNVKPKALYQQRYRGEAPGSLGIRLGKQILFRRADLEDWINAQAENERLDREARFS